VDSGSDRVRLVFNWLWYRIIPAGPGLANLMTDREEVLREVSLSAGAVPKTIITALHQDATNQSPPPLAELALATTQFFLQAVIDCEVDRIAWGPMCLIGDATFVARSHVAAGQVFILGLILVINGGAELFTGNNLIITAWARAKVSTGLLLKNWVIVYFGNYARPLATAGLMFFSGQCAFRKVAVGMVALATANNKSGLYCLQALVLGILRDALVCVAVWLTFSANTTTDRIMAIITPTSAFVAAGFEHSVANMYKKPTPTRAHRRMGAGSQLDLERRYISFGRLSFRSIKLSIYLGYAQSLRCDLSQM